VLRTYIELNIFRVDSSNNLDKLLQAEFLLFLMLIVECYYPDQNPAKVDIDVIFLFIVELLYSGPSLTDG
jgi:hypothetical protein